MVHCTYVHVPEVMDVGVVVMYGGQEIYQPWMTITCQKPWPRLEPRTQR